MVPTLKSRTSHKSLNTRIQGKLGSTLESVCDTIHVILIVIQVWKHWPKGLKEYTQKMARMKLRGQISKTLEKKYLWEQIICRSVGAIRERTAWLSSLELGGWVYTDGFKKKKEMKKETYFERMTAALVLDLLKLMCLSGILWKSIYNCEIWHTQKSE